MHCDCFCFIGGYLESISVHSWSKSRFYKDLSSWAGAVRLIQHRSEIDWQAMHAVKMSLEEFPRIAPAAKRAVEGGRAVLPQFVGGKQQLAVYLSELEEIAVANGLK